MDKIDVVNKDNIVVGHASKEEIYSQNLSHRMVHVLVCDKHTKQLYIPKTAAHCSFPNALSTTNRHLRSGQSYEDAAAEAISKLGIPADITKVGSYSYSDGTHTSFLGVFMAETDQDITHNEDFVSGGYYTWDEAKDAVKSEDVHPHLAYILSKLN